MANWIIPSLELGVPAMTTVQIEAAALSVTFLSKWRVRHPDRTLSPPPTAAAGLANLFDCEHRSYASRSISFKLQTAPVKRSGDHTLHKVAFDVNPPSRPR
ncbi:hypothetical protein SERLADRAFT_434737 [Serpula lacrymans var. lacrymans S7.9]|uniref:Uncharacterized protein n=1 Tax=Serpula lacrymans var. lacrymans (strain S7.9) TaxID=578457 RepID=F8NKX8_SERL9|nr:uncharacterized protein SERLADRAFT_434737 [Serpula lacrymans var. lacrymans S7.9]EGO28847.1 hypothetical protein SERLADRAFT_434737 [Serpula lacrymans var. lacrymans S7.9]